MAEDPQDPFVNAAQRSQQQQQQSQVTSSREAAKPLSAEELQKLENEAL